MKIAVTADLHWGHRRGAEETKQLVSFVTESPPDLLVLAGDQGSDDQYEECLALFDHLDCLKALVPGNHDLWVKLDGKRDSLQRYEEDLPLISSRHGFHYLDHGPLYLDGGDLALVGTMNWYDYSWSEERLRERYPDELERLATKRFTRGRHNDARFVRTPLGDKGLTDRIVDRFERQLTEALERVQSVIVVTHHPPWYALSRPDVDAVESLDGLLWDGFSGNRRMEALIVKMHERIEFAFCGHVHRTLESQLHSIRGHNVGGDYGFKRLLVLDRPSGAIESHQFGASA